MEEIKEVEKMVTNDEETKKKRETKKASSKEPKKSTTTKKRTTRENKEKVEEANKTTNKSNTSKENTKKVTNAKTTNNKEIKSKETYNKKTEKLNTLSSKTATKKNTSTKTTTSKAKNIQNKTNKEISNEKEKIDKPQQQTTKKKKMETKTKKENIEKNVDEEVKIVIKEEKIQEQKVEPKTKQEIIEENAPMDEANINPEENEEIKTKKKHSKLFIIFSILVIIVIMAFSTIFALMNKVSNKIIYGISIKGIDVSGLTIEQATDKMNNAFEEQWKKDITLKYEDFETVVTPEQIEMKFNVDEAVKLAYSIGRTGNVLKDNYSIINANISKQEINVGYSYNEEALANFIASTGGNLPNLVKQSSYSINGSNLIIDKGEKGISIEEEILKKQIIQECATLRRKSSYTNFNFRKRTKCN